MGKKVALITGIFGQDGSYLLELLQGKGYEVHGVTRDMPSENSLAIRQYLSKKGLEPCLHRCDLNSYADVRKLIEALSPQECYHLAATHFSSQVKDAPVTENELFQNNVLSILNILQAVYECSAETRVLFAGSCLMFDAASCSPQKEETPYRSSSIYGVSKVSGGQLVELYRETYGLHASTAVLYNHESPRRPAHFVSKKIVRGVVEVANRATAHFTLGNLDSVKDWGYARDYVQGMWVMAQQAVPRDYILATGETHTVEDFIAYAAQYVGLKDWKNHVRLKEGLTRPSPKTLLIGDATLAGKNLGWKPSMSLKQLAELMVFNEMNGKLD